MASQAALNARALLFQRKLAEATVDFSIPGVSELDGQLSILEMTGTQLDDVQSLAKEADGSDPSKPRAMAAGICLALIMRADKERVFSDTDIDAVEAMGLSVLVPLNALVEKTSALDGEAMAAAKKSSSTDQTSASNTSLPIDSSVPAVNSSTPSEPVSTPTGEPTTN